MSRLTIISRAHTLLGIVYTVKVKVINRLVFPHFMGVSL
uniref:Uncharacterized protein n=1 Tax=Anguilla anguilla TaxID=7936 RepID=A0A0E9PJN2_ANGAN